MHLALPAPAGRRRTRRLPIAALVAIAALWCCAASAIAAPLTATTTPVDSALTTDTYALLGGIVNPGGAQATYFFEWGTSTSYGQTTPVTPASNGSADVPVDYSLDGLQPSTTYHYRVVATPAGKDASANVYGADQTFTTASALALQVVGSLAKVQGGKAQITLEAVGPADTELDGILTVKVVVKGKAKTLTLLPYTLVTGAKKTFAVRLPAAVRAALKGKGPNPRLKLSAKSKGVKAPVVKTLKLAG